MLFVYHTHWGYEWILTPLWMIATPAWNFYCSFVVFNLPESFFIDGQSRIRWRKSFSTGKTPQDSLMNKTNLPSKIRYLPEAPSMRWTNMQKFTSLLWRDAKDRRSYWSGWLTHERRACLVREADRLLEECVDPPFPQPMRNRASNKAVSVAYFLR